MDFPSPTAPLFINSFSRWSALVDLQSAAAPTSALTWTANTAIYIPFYVMWPFPVRRVFWANGSTTTSTNMDFGIYNADGTQLYHTGSTAASGASVLQYTTPTEFVLSPGRYYMAYACSSSTASRGGTGLSSVTIARSSMAGILQESSALPLPATMTPVTMVITPYPICGITQTASGF